MIARRSRSRLVGLALALALSLSPGCRATGEAANGYFEWGGRTFTTNPGSVAFYFVGFGVFYVAGLPLDLFSWIATLVGWPDGAGEDYQASALAPSIFLGVTGGALLGAPFFPFGLPWWIGSDDDEPAKSRPAAPPGQAPPSQESPTGQDKPPAKAPPADDSPRAGAPR